MGEIPSIRFLRVPLADCGGLPLLLKLKYFFWAAAAHKDAKNPGQKGTEEVGVLRCTQPSQTCTWTWPFIVRNSIEYLISLGGGDCSRVREVRIGAYNVLKLIAQLNCLTVVNYHF